MASLEELEGALKKQYHKMISKGGLRRTAKREIRQLGRGFYGAGLPHAGVEAVIAQCNKLLMHYGCQSSTGVQLQVSKEILIFELGTTFQPFQENYDAHKSW